MNSPAPRSPVPYYGSKSSIAAQIAALLPEHNHYVEPYAGSLAVLLEKPRSRMETVNDLDEELVTFWRVLRDRRAELEELCALTPHSRAEHRDSFTSAGDELEVARSVWIRLTQGRDSRLTPTGWRYHVSIRGGRETPLPVRMVSQRARLHPAAERLMGVTLECRPALDVIGSFGANADVLLYVDPPYLGETRCGTNYRHEMPHPAQHRELAEALHACNAAVVLSGYPSDLYDRELYPDWDRIEIAARSDQGGKSAARTEVLWSNRPLAAADTNSMGLFDLAAKGA